ncbi:MAG: glycosyltransferase family 4 protein [Chloroflexota bacterium]
MKNILMLTPYLPYPPISGGRSRTYNLIKHVMRDYQITLVCFGRPEEQTFDISPLRRLCEVFVVDRTSSPSTIQAALMSVTSIQPITMRLYSSPDFRQVVVKLLNERTYDLIHVESFYMIQNVPQDVPVPILLAEPAIEYIAWRRHAQVAQPFYQRPAIALEALKMRLFEPQAWGQATLVGVMSPIDAQIVKQATPGVATALTPNGVDIDYFKPSDSPREVESAVYMGDYKYFPNSDAVRYFVREIMPLIRQKKPGFTLTLIGKDPTPDMIALGKDPASGVHVAGLVDDTRPYLTQATLFVCPLRSGSGTRYKLLEALSSGCPVVTTSVGSEGLEPRNGYHMLLADTPRSFADAVLRILNSPEEAARLGRQGRAWVAETHAWKRSARLLGDAYDMLIGSDDMTIRRSIKSINL